jgi:hypothetical protein
MKAAEEIGLSLADGKADVQGHVPAMSVAPM